MAQRLLRKVGRFLLWRGGADSACQVPYRPGFASSSFEIVTSRKPRRWRSAMIVGNASAVAFSPTCIRMMAPSSSASVLPVMRSIRNSRVFRGSTEQNFRPRDFVAHDRIGLFRQVRVIPNVVSNLVAVPRNCLGTMAVPLRPVTRNKKGAVHPGALQSRSIARPLAAEKSTGTRMFL